MVPPLSWSRSDEGPEPGSPACPTDQHMFGLETWTVMEGGGWLQNTGRKNLLRSSVTLVAFINQAWPEINESGVNGESS